MLCMLCRSRVTTRMHVWTIMSCTAVPCDVMTDQQRQEESQEACLLVCYDQWWVSRVVDAIANCIHYLCWKEAIAVSSVHQKLVRKQGRQWRSANDARTFERRVFSKSHTTKTLKTLSITLWHLVFDVQTRYAADFVAIDRHTHTYTHTHTHTHRHRHRQNNYHNYPYSACIKGW